MKAKLIIASIAASLLLFAAAPTASAQRGSMQRSQHAASGSGYDSRGSHNSGGNSAPQVSSSRQGGGNQSATRSNGGGQAPRNNGGNMGSRPMGSANGPAMGHGGNPVRRAEGGHALNPSGPRNNGPRQYGGGAPRQAGPAAAGPRRAGGPAPAAGPRRAGGPAPAVGGPRHYAGPAGGPRAGFAPRPMHAGPAVYHPYIDRRARVFYIDEVPYYTWGGVYYRYVPSYGYEEIVMPEDVVVTELPYGAAQVYVNDIGYYEADGMWFQPVEGGYLMVQRPVAHVTVAVPRPHFSFHASFGF